MSANATANAERIAKINALTQEQRDEAYDSAKRRIAGKRPQLSDFQANTREDMPRLLSVAITAMVIMVLVAAYIPSAMRIYKAVNDTGDYIGNETQSAIIAVCAVLIAEIAQLAFTMYAGRVETTSDKRMLYALAFACVLFAYVANYHVTKPHERGELIVWLETFLPPTLALGAANIMKTQMLHGIRTRRAADNAFKDALSAWDRNYENASQVAQWDRTLANALRDAIRNANKASKAVLRELTTEDWRALVIRERMAEDWYDEGANAVTQLQSNAPSQTQIPTSAPVRALPNARPQTHVPPQSQTDASNEETQPSDAIANAPIAVRSIGRTSGTYSGKYANIAFEVTPDGRYVKVCPECGFRTAPNATQRGASASMSAHSKKHADERAEGAQS